MGRIATKRPQLAVQLGEEAISYLFATQDLGLFYGECRGDEGCGPEGGLALPRSMKRVECFSDISFAPQGEKSVQGIIGTYGGSPIQWESSRQTYCSLSTAEAELYGYVESMPMCFLVGRDRGAFRPVLMAARRACLCDHDASISTGTGMILVELEPTIPGSIGRCLIHWATGPVTTTGRGWERVSHFLGSPLATEGPESLPPCS